MGERLARRKPLLREREIQKVAAAKIPVHSGRHLEGRLFARAQQAPDLFKAAIMVRQQLVHALHMALHIEAMRAIHVLHVHRAHLT